jgi:hypothetical protein
VQAWLAPDPVGRLRGWRDAVDAAGAHELLVRIGPSRLLSDIRALGVVAAPALRCSSHQMDLLALDAYAWITAKEHLHRAPA